MRLRIVIDYGRTEALTTELDQPMGGIRSAVLGLCGALARRGHDVHLFGKCSQPGRYRGLEYHDRLEFATVAQRYEADVLVSVPPALAVLLPLAARMRVVWTHSALQSGDCALVVPWTWADHEGAEGREARLYNLSVLQPYIDRVICGSRWQARFTSETMGIPRSKFSVIHLGIPLEHYPRETPLRHRYRLVYASQASRGLEPLLRLLPCIRERVPEAELHVFGYRSPKHRDYQRIGRNMIDQPGVTLRGQLSKSALAQEFCSAAIMSYPCTITETFCLAIAEAQAAGLPVVTSDGSGLSERVSHGVDGFLVRGRPGDPSYDSAFVEAVERLLRDDVLWRTMSGEAARKARQAYDWDRLAAQWEEVLQENLTGRQPATPRANPSFDLLDPSLLVVRKRRSEARVPRELAAEWIRAGWAAYGYSEIKIPLANSNGADGRRAR